MHLHNLKVLKRFVFTYIISFSFLVLWFTIGSGRYTINTLKQKDIVFMNMVKSADTKPIELSFVTAANFANIKAKIGTIVTDNFLLTNNIFDKLNGWLNLVFCLILASIFIVVFNFSAKENSVNKKAIYLLLALISSIGFYFIFSLNPLYYIYLAVFLVLVFVLFKEVVINQKWKNGYLLFAIICTIVPIFVTIFGALRAGHTANIYQKYLSFGLPVSFTLMALGIYYIFKNKSYLAKVILLIFCIYLVKIFEIDKEVLNDNYPKYTILSKREPNPYYSVANKLERLYQPGDTIIYPNTGHTAFDKYDFQMKQDYISVLDAQLTNIYLPKSADYIQRVEANEADKIYLYQIKSNSKKLIFDFEGKKYRY
jgi:hypothetical protein